MGARGKREGRTGVVGTGGWESLGGLRPFHQWGHVCLREEKKQGVVNDKLIGGICSPHGLVLTWRPDGLGMVCQLIRLCSAPHPLQERLFTERKGPVQVSTFTIWLFPLQPQPHKGWVYFYWLRWPVACARRFSRHQRRNVSGEALERRLLLQTTG